MVSVKQETITNEKIKSDLYGNLVPIYHLSKLFGLLPVKFHKDKTGRYIGRLDLKQVVYGYV